jgi:tetraacyldisaccharide 4'-kinase
MPVRSHRWQRVWSERGPLACSLLPLAALFGIASALHRGLYRSGLLRVERLPVRIIVVGNLIAGGAGKTPTVLALVRALQSGGRSPAIVSRGYGGTASEPMEVETTTSARVGGDEPLLMRRRAGVPVFVGRDRVAAVRALLHAYPRTDVVVADDGLQHHRLGRDVQVLVFDERGAGNGWLLPAGPLREALPPAVPGSQRRALQRGQRRRRR